MQALTKKEKENAYREWIARIARTESVEAIKAHMIKHSYEIYDRDPSLWCASMENMLEIYRAKMDVANTVDEKISRLANHHNKNKAKGPLPPKQIRLGEWLPEELLRVRLIEK